jgi:hypothetical protein
VTAVPDDTTAWLNANDDQVTRIDATHWATEQHLHHDVA